MASVIREGDTTTTGGVVLQTSGTQTYEERRLARMGDPVWCAACERVGYIAQGNPTYIDDLVAVATDGQRVRCECPNEDHRLIASQEGLKADMNAAIDIPKDLARKARKRAKQLTKALRQESPLTQDDEASAAREMPINAPYCFPADDAARRIAGSACDERPGESAACSPDVIHAF
jgi:uncharacterized Zn-binding protein involved in type VI secretion